MKDLKEKVAIITGGAGGIGLAIARALAARHCHIALVDIDEQGLQAAQAMLMEQFRIKVSVHCIDVSEVEAMKELPQSILKVHDHVDILINNAGVSVNEIFETLRLDDFHWLMNINFWGTVYGCKFFLPYLRERESSHIVNVLSNFAITGFPGKSTYCASKAALLGFSNALYTELYGSSVGLSIILPGPVSTEIVKAGRSATEEQRAREINFMKKNSLNPDHVASRIVDAILKNKYRVRIGGIIYLMDYLVRLFPVLTHKIIARNRKRVAFID